MAIEIVDTRSHDSIDISKSYSIDKIEIYSVLESKKDMENGFVIWNKSFPSMNKENSQFIPVE